MKASELMIGDWIRMNKYQNVRVSRLSEHSDYPNCEPIPLTPEILEKNGFEKDPESGELIWADNNVTEVVWLGTILTILGEYANTEFSTCMFVHQLQHALHLCGIEKEIEL